MALRNKGARSAVLRLIKSIAGKAKDESNIFASRKPTREEFLVADFLRAYASPVTAILLSAREDGKVIRGPRLGYHVLKGTGGDVYTGGYALAVKKDSPDNVRVGSNKFFGFEWEIVELGYIYLLPVQEKKGNLIGADYLTRGVEYVNGANIFKRQSRLDHVKIEESLYDVLEMWGQSIRGWS